MKKLNFYALPSLFGNRWDNFAVKNPILGWFKTIAPDYF
jgi:hypothetical protein